MNLHHSMPMPHAPAERVFSFYLLLKRHLGSLSTVSATPRQERQRFGCSSIFSSFLSYSDKCSKNTCLRPSSRGLVLWHEEERLLGLPSFGSGGSHLARCWLSPHSRGPTCKDFISIANVLRAVHKTLAGTELCVLDNDSKL